MNRRSVVLTVGPDGSLPWWWDEAREDPRLCPLQVRNIAFRGKSSKQVTPLELPAFLLKTLKVYLSVRREADYIFTFECSLATWAVAFWQTVLFSRSPRHVVLQFIMRPRTNRMSSKIKYAVMRWWFSSIHLVICSSRSEAAYYMEVFHWREQKVAFVPYHSAKRFLEDIRTGDGGYVFAAGRAFRDFITFYAAVKESAHKVVVVAGAGAPQPPPDSKNIRFMSEIPLSEFEELINNCTVVVLPLEKLPISTGQLVLLHAMSLGKAVIATRVTGTIDYIEDGANGLLVEPQAPEQLRSAIDLVMSDAHLRQRLGAAARQTIVERHLPRHYSAAVRAAITSR